MKKIRFIRLSIKNFKGVKEYEITFKDFMEICGRNASGKTTLYDAICWILFGKDSVGNAKFEIRELDKDGNKVHNTIIEVVLVIEVDGVTYELKKRQLEKWVRRRGEQAQEYAGNENEFSISDFPKTEKEFKQFIASIIDEKIFKILTNPVTFPSLDWKEQRQILFSIIGDIDTSEFKSIEYFDLLAPELALVPVDDIKKKWTKSKNELKKKPDEIQTRIDEVSGQIIDVDIQPLLEEKERIQSEISRKESKLLELSHVSDSETDNAIVRLRLEQEALANKANTERNDAIRSAQLKVDDLQRKYQSCVYTVTTIEEELTKCEDERRERARELAVRRDELKKAQEQTFPEGKDVCPTCGQKLPKSKLEKAQKEWFDAQNVYINALKENVGKLSKDITIRTELIEKYGKQLAHARADEKGTESALDEAKTELNKLQSMPTVDTSDIPEYLEIESQILELDKNRVDMSQISAEMELLKSEIVKHKSDLVSIEVQIQTANSNEKYRNRIAQLQDELREVGQKISDCDKMLYAVDEYVKALSQKINEQFDGLHFKLFESQFNGGVKECCSITLNGVPYESLNSGHKIVAGLSIIHTLRYHYQINVPVIVDNAETISSGNIPQMDGQLILLRVTDDEALTVR